MIGLLDLESLFGALRERGFPLLLALQAVLGSLQLLDALRVGYYPMIRRETNLVRFGLGVILVVPLGLLLLCWGVWMVRGVWARLVVAPALGLFLYPVLGLEGCVALASLLAAAELWSHRCFGCFLFGVFGLLGLPLVSEDKGIIEARRTRITASTLTKIL